MIAQAQQGFLRGFGASHGGSMLAKHGQGHDLGDLRLRRVQWLVNPGEALCRSIELVGGLRIVFFGRTRTRTTNAICFLQWWTTRCGPMQCVAPQNLSK